MRGIIILIFCLSALASKKKCFENAVKVKGKVYFVDFDQFSKPSETNHSDSLAPSNLDEYREIKKIIDVYGEVYEVSEDKRLLLDRYIDIVEKDFLHLLDTDNYATLDQETVWRWHEAFRDLIHLLESFTFEKVSMTKKTLSYIENLEQRKDKIFGVYKDQRIELLLREAGFTFLSKEYIRETQSLKPYEKIVEEFKEIHFRKYLSVDANSLVIITIVNSINHKIKRLKDSIGDINSYLTDYIEFFTYHRKSSKFYGIQEISAFHTELIEFLESQPYLEALTIIKNTEGEGNTDFVKESLDLIKRLRAIAGVYRGETVQ